MRSRSAAAWRSMASCMFSEGLMSWISTERTVTPQSSVCSDIASRRRALICSRLDKASSRSMAPTMARSEVMVRLVTAKEKFCTP
ncbi:hypothetical protein D3C75_1195780 [compost metagenome]